MKITFNNIIIIVIIILAIAIYINIHKIEKLTNPNGSPLGGKCKISSDCADFGGAEKIVCCNSGGFDNPFTEFGICTKPCINTGVGWCPSTADQRNIRCEKELGEPCKLDTDCKGWGGGIGGFGNKCKDGVCYNPYETITEVERPETNNSQLFPVRKLDLECREKGLFGSFMPRVCNRTSGLDVTRNCKCVDKNGVCQICYDSIAIKNHNYKLTKDIELNNSF